MLVRRLLRSASPAGATSGRPEVGWRRQLVDRGTEGPIHAAEQWHAHQLRESDGREAVTRESRVFSTRVSLAQRVDSGGDMAVSVGGLQWRVQATCAFSLEKLLRPGLAAAAYAEDGGGERQARMIWLQPSAGD